MVDLRHNRYGLPAEKLTELTEQCMERCVDPRSGLAVLELFGSDPLSDVARNIERELFDRAFGETVPHSPDLMTHEYGPYEDRSTFFMVLDVETRSAIAVLRVISGLPNKSIHDLQRANLLSDAQLDAYGFTDSTTWDVATAAVSRAVSHRSSQLAALTLYRALYMASLWHQISDWTSVIDGRALRSYANIGIPFNPFENIPELNYLGSNATACHCEVKEVRNSIVRTSATGRERVPTYIRSLLDGSPLVPELSKYQVIDLTRDRLST